MWRGERFEIADPSTPLGMLQRGRGAAYLWAREAPPEEAARLLLRCLDEDPRWDRTVEDSTPPPSSPSSARTPRATRTRRTG